MEAAEALLGADLFSGLTNGPRRGFVSWILPKGGSEARRTTVGNIQGPVVGSALLEPEADDVKGNYWQK